VRKSFLAQTFFVSLFESGKPRLQNLA